MMTVNSKLAALLGAAFVATGFGAFAAPATLGGSLGQLVSRWENGDPHLSHLLSRHLASPGGDPLVDIHVQDGIPRDQVLAELSAAGFRLTALSSIDPRVIE